jgi:hypothetical protein
MKMTAGKVNPKSVETEKGEWRKLTDLRAKTLKE